MLKGTRKEYLKGSRRHGGYRFSTDAYLHSRLGRPWAEVHSELSREFDRRTYAGYCFWRRLRWDFAQTCWIGAETGTIYSSVSHWGTDCPVSGYYVHPFTGLLCYAEPPVPPQRPEDFSTIRLTDGSWYANEEVGKSPKHRFNAWFHYRMEKVTEVYRRYLDVAQAQACRMAGKLRVEEDENGFFVWQWSSRDKIHKRSVNRADMIWIRNYIADKLKDRYGKEKALSQNQ